MEKNKKVAVLFSGGLDSTYLVWKNLTDGNYVTPIYIEIGNNKIKSKLEKNRIKLLHKEFSKEFNDDRVLRQPLLKEIQYILKVNVDACENSLYFKQVPIWILGVLFSQSLGVDEIQIAYVNNDDAIAYLSDIQNIYQSYQAVCEPLIPLVFPSTKLKKYEMAHKLPAKYRDFIISCECPEIIGSEDAEIMQYKPCCECVPCKHIIADDYYGLNYYPDNYKSGLISQHAKALNREGFKVIDKNGNDYYDSFSIETSKKEPYQLELQFE